MSLTESRVNCPYCGEPLTLLVDEGDSGVDYTEDCQVCCQPMLVSIFASEGTELFASVRREDE
ncbi:MAG: CPXCG motif-containing cysteine-rich protein [Congregibacter sp.]